MQERLNPDASLKIKFDDFFKNNNLDSESDILRIFELMQSRVDSLLEKNKPLPVPAENSCTFSNNCYTAKTKMGPCPCEFYKDL
jgi:hypothetical protein